MSKDGAAINQAFIQVRKFLVEVAKLFSAADEIVLKAEWSPSDDKLYSASGRLDDADSWIPWCATRFYTHERADSAVLYVGVLFDYYDDTKHAVARLPEPMATCGSLLFGAAKDRDWYPWHGALHFYCKGSADGSVIDYCPKDFIPPSWCSAKKATSLAIPLISVTSPDILAEKCITPILDRFKEQSKKGTK